MAAKELTDKLGIEIYDCTSSKDSSDSVIINTKIVEMTKYLLQNEVTMEACNNSQTFCPISLCPSSLTHGQH